LILRPVEPISEIIASIRVQAQTISIFYPEYKEELRLILKGLFYTWHKPIRYQDRCWQRSILTRNGLLEDRLIELCYKLLEVNFIIDLPENYNNLIDKILSGDYHEEQTRWILAHDTELLAIDYNRKKENYYHQARLLPNSHYDKPYVVIKSIYYDQIIDFASLYNFSITEKAMEILTVAKVEKLKQIRVELKPRIYAKKENSAFGEEKKKSGTTELIGVADEFLDQD
jgi:hypothetical protein